MSNFITDKERGIGEDLEGRFEQEIINLLKMRIAPEDYTTLLNRKNKLLNLFSKLDAYESNGLFIRLKKYNRHDELSKLLYEKLHNATISNILHIVKLKRDEYIGISRKKDQLEEFFLHYIKFVKNIRTITEYYISEKDMIRNPFLYKLKNLVSLLKKEKPTPITVATYKQYSYEIEKFIIEYGEIKNRNDMIYFDARHALTQLNFDVINLSVEDEMMKSSSVFETVNITGLDFKLINKKELESAVSKTIEFIKKSKSTLDGLLPEGAGDLIKENAPKFKTAIDQLELLRKIITAVDIKKEFDENKSSGKLDFLGEIKTATDLSNKVLELCKYKSQFTLVGIKALIKRMPLEPVEQSKILKSLDETIDIIGKKIGTIAGFIEFISTAVSLIKSIKDGNSKEITLNAIRLSNSALSIGMAMAGVGAGITLAVSGVGFLVVETVGLLFDLSQILSTIEKNATNRVLINMYNYSIELQKSAGKFIKAAVKYEEIQVKHIESSAVKQEQLLYEQILKEEGKNIIRINDGIEYLLSNIERSKSPDYLKNIKNIYTRSFNDYRYFGPYFTYFVGINILEEKLKFALYVARVSISINETLIYGLKNMGKIPADEMLKYFTKIQELKKNLANYALIPADVFVP